MTDFKGSLGKNYQGTFAGGEGPVLGMDSKIEPEPKGPFGGEMKHLDTMSGGPQHDQYDGAEEKGFSLQGAGYRGPENMTPNDQGVHNNFDINGESKAFLNKGR